MRLYDILTQHPEWQTYKYTYLDIQFQSHRKLHSATINLMEVRTIWQRIKFAIWIFKALGGKK